MKERGLREKSGKQDPSQKLLTLKIILKDPKKKVK